MIKEKTKKELDLSLILLTSGTTIAIVVLMIIILVWGFSIGQESVRKQAIKEGYGEFYFDKESDDKQWRWKKSGIMEELIRFKKEAEEYENETKN